MQNLARPPRFIKIDQELSLSPVLEKNLETLNQTTLECTPSVFGFVAFPFWSFDALWQHSGMVLQDKLGFNTNTMQNI